MRHTCQVSVCLARSTLFSLSVKSQTVLCYIQSIHSAAELRLSELSHLLLESLQIYFVVVGDGSIGSQ